MNLYCGNRKKVEGKIVPLDNKLKKVAKKIKGKLQQKVFLNGKGNSITKSIIYGKTQNTLMNKNLPIPKKNIT